MKKTLTLLVALTLVLALCAGCSKSPKTAGKQDASSPSAAQAGRNAELDAAFAAGGPIRLVPAELSGSPGEDWTAISLSPDGKTVLWKGDGNWALTRDGTAVPVVFNPEKGAGDPYGNSKRVLRIMRELPGPEGLSWSADGRWIAISYLHSAFVQMRSIDAPVVDTASGETWLVDSINSSIKEDLSGYILLNKVDRSGKYLYYLLQQRRGTGDDSQTHLCFCRCPVEGGSREVLCDMVYEEGCAYDVTSSSNLFEAADGSWLLTGTNRFYRSSQDGQLALIRFSASGDKWTQEVTSLGVPGKYFAFDYTPWSPASGYGLFCLSFPLIQQTDQAAMEGSVKQTQNVWSQIPGYVNLLRLHPGAEAKHDVWCLKKTGDDYRAVEMVPAEDFLWALKLKSGRLEAGEKPAAAAWLSQNGSGEGDPVPKGYDEEALLKDIREEARLFTLCSALSPDGYYALINARVGKDCHLYLVSLETMKVLPVDAPEGVAGVQLGNNPMGRGYLPGIFWNQDGTLLIELADQPGHTGAFRLETGPAAE